jgi:hypothetical protein
MAQLFGRESTVRRIASAVDRARPAGTGTIIVCGPAGVGTSAVVDEVMRPFGPDVSRARGALPPDTASPIWWIDDAQRMSRSDAERLHAVPTGGSRIVLLSGRSPLGPDLAEVVRDAMRVDPGCVVDVAPLVPADAIEAVVDPTARKVRDG